MSPLHIWGFKTAVLEKGELQVVHTPNRDLLGGFKQLTITIVATKGLIHAVLTETKGG